MFRGGVSVRGPCSVAGALVRRMGYWEGGRRCCKDNVPAFVLVQLPGSLDLSNLVKTDS